MSVPLRILLGFSILLFSLLFFTIPTLAANIQLNPSQFVGPKGEPATPENYNYSVHGQVTIEGSIFHTILCTVGGFSPVYKCGGFKPNPNGEASIWLYDRLPSGGAVGMTTNSIAMLYANQPISSTFYLAQVGQNMGIIPRPAYAQVNGSGSGILTPVYNLWKTLRDLAYLLFIAVFVTVGLMIMFRQKINPQTVISVQAALPSLIIGLILVTFSYFFSALLVDLSFVGMQVVTQVFVSSYASGSPNTFCTAGATAQACGAELTKLSQNANILQFFSATAFNSQNMGTAASGVSGQLTDTVFAGNHTMAMVIPAIVGGIIGFFMGFGPVGALIGGITGAASTDYVIPIIVMVIIVVALAIAMIRLAVALITAYIQILVFTMLAPVYILMGSIPGKGSNTATWYKGILGNALIFPAVLGAFLFAGTILGSSSANTVAPFFGGIDGDFIKTILGFGIIMATPAIPDMVRKAVGVSGPQAFSQAAIGGFKAGFGLTSGVVKKGKNRMFEPLDKQRAAYSDAMAKWRVGLADEPPALPSQYRGINWLPRRFTSNYITRNQGERPAEERPGVTGGRTPRPGTTRTP